MPSTRSNDDDPVPMDHRRLVRETARKESRRQVGAGVRCGELVEQALAVELGLARRDIGEELGDRSVDHATALEIAAPPSVPLWAPLSALTSLRAQPQSLRRRTRRRQRRQAATLPAAPGETAIA